MRYWRRAGVIRSRNRASYAAASPASDSVCEAAPCAPSLERPTLIRYHQLASDTRAGKRPLEALAIAHAFNVNHDDPGVLVLNQPFDAIRHAKPGLVSGRNPVRQADAAPARAKRRTRRRHHSVTPARSVRARPAPSLSAGKSLHRGSAVCLRLDSACNTCYDTSGTHFQRETRGNAGIPLVDTGLDCSIT